MIKVKTKNEKNIYSSKIAFKIMTLIVIKSNSDILL